MNRDNRQKSIIGVRAYSLSQVIMGSERESCQQKKFM